MDFSLSDEQQLLVDSVGRFLRNEYDFETRRRLAATSLGWDEGNWRTIAEMGLTALLVPESFGGIGGTMADMALVAEQFGRHLVLEPYLPTAILGPVALTLGGSDAARQELLPADRRRHDQDCLRPSGTARTPRAHIRDHPCRTRRRRMADCRPQGSGTQRGNSGPDSGLGPHCR